MNADLYKNQNRYKFLKKRGGRVKYPKMSFMHQIRFTDIICSASANIEEPRRRKNRPTAPNILT